MSTGLWMLALTTSRAAIVAALPWTGDPAAARVERTVPMMGTVLELVVEAEDRQAALAASERAIRALEAAEARLSTWREDSELSRLNRAPVGEPTRLSPELSSELEAAVGCFEQTGGAFDPGIGAVLDAWALRDGGRVPSTAELAAARASGGFAALALEGEKPGGAESPVEVAGGGRATRRRPAATAAEAAMGRAGPGGVRVTRLHAGLRIEEGAWGKGAGLDRAVEALAAVDRPVRALLDLGGQVSVAGGGPAWEVEVADPRQRERPVLRLSLAAGSVATSGGSERSLSVNGRRLSHIFDPRTGRPAPDFGSLTVVAQDGLTADCLSTGLYVLGPEAALAWAAERDGIEVLVLEPRGAGLLARVTPGLAGRVEVLYQGVTLEVFSRPP